MSRDVETIKPTGYRYIHYGDIHKQVADLITSSTKLPYIKYGNYIPLSQGDLVLADASEDYTGIAEPCVIIDESTDKIVAGLHTIALRPRNAASLYLYYLLHTDNFKKFGNQMGTGLKVFGITFDNLSLFKTNMPSVPEQTAIGNFFRTLDDAITLHKRKLEELKKLKSAYLQQMFPQAGESVPRVRFAGFTELWEERKLGEVADIVGGGTPRTDNNEYWDGDINWYTPAEIGTQIFVVESKKKITKLGMIRSSAKILPIGTVLFTSRAGIGNTAILAREGATNQGFQSIIPHKNKLDTYFIFSRTHELKQYGETVGAGSTFVEVSGKQMSKMPLLIPCLSEQTLIGNFFCKFDEQIPNQERKLGQLQQLKSAYLQKMLI